MKSLLSLLILLGARSSLWALCALGLSSQSGLFSRLYLQSVRFIFSLEWATEAEMFLYLLKKSEQQLLFRLDLEGV